MNDDEGMNRADVVALASGYGSVGGIAEDDGVDLVGIVFVVGGCRSRWHAGGTVGSSGEMEVSSVIQSIED
jgi:hypothetical protein